METSARHREISDVNEVQEPSAFDLLLSGKRQERLWTREQRIPRKAGLQGARL